MVCACLPRRLGGAKPARANPGKITQDDSSLRAAPAGFDSVLAVGRVEPDPSKDAKLQLDGRDVAVPQGKPMPNKDPALAKMQGSSWGGTWGSSHGGSSSFQQSEYLVYRESQARLRYIITFNW